MWTYLFCFCVGQFLSDEESTSKEEEVVDSKFEDDEWHEDKMESSATEGNKEVKNMNISSVLMNLMASYCSDESLSEGI